MTSILGYTTTLIILTSFVPVHSVTREQVTKLLDKLLKSYDKMIRPGYGKMPLYINSNILIRSIGPVTEIDMAYSMQLYFRQVWYDKRLEFKLGNVTELTLNNRFLHKIWKPDTFFLNGKKSYQHDITVPNMFVRVRYDGRLIMSRRMTIVARCPMELARYPMDQPVCHLVIGSYGYAVDDIVYIWKHENQKAVEVMADVTMSQFDIGPIYSRNLTRHNRNGEYSILEVSFYFYRNLGFFILQTYLPCYLIVALSWVSFWINRDAAPARVLLGVTSILSTAAIGMTVREGLPRVPYATALDVFLNVCLVYNLSALIEYAGVNYFTKTISPEKIKDDEEEALLSSSAIAMNTKDRADSETLLDAPSGGAERENQKYSSEKCPTVFWYCLVGNHRYRVKKVHEGENYINSVSKIDLVSRYLFPISFGLFNTLYWIIYLRARFIKWN